MALFQKKSGGNAEGRAVPRHIAIIMDGNGRWAKKRGLPRTAGHAAGAETFRRIATYCRDIGLEYLTVYAFSTENWKRSEAEVSAIMGLLEKYLLEAISDMEKNRVCIGFFGDLSRLSPKLRELARQASARSQEFEGVQANLCINYGGRDEIVRDPDLVIRPSGEIRISNFLLWQSAYAEFYFTDVLWPDFTPEELERAIESYNGRSRRFGGVK